MNAPRQSLAVFVVIMALALSSCATSEEVRLRQRVKELESERAELITLAWKQRQYISELHNGMALQARMAANLRSTCDI